LNIVYHALFTLGRSRHHDTYARQDTVAADLQQDIEDNPMSGERAT